MARPSARRKIKNPSSKTSRHLAKKRLRKRPVPQDAGVGSVLLPFWSNKLTTRQNYERLGLMSSINGMAGGSDGKSDRINVSINDVMESEEWGQLDGGYQKSAVVDEKPVIKSQLDVVEEAVIERDQDGNVVGVKIIGTRAADTNENTTTELNEEEEKKKQEEVEKESIRKQVISELEEFAKNERKVETWQSINEREFYRRCIDKHGNDYKAMARDLKLNVWQNTPAQLKKGIARYRASLESQQ